MSLPTYDIDDAQKWESGELGRDESFVRKSEKDDQSIDDKVGLQMISIRLQKSLLEDLKAIAEIHGISYQPLMKQVLKRFVDTEKKQILRERASQAELDKELDKKVV